MMTFWFTVEGKVSEEEADNFLSEMEDFLRRQNLDIDDAGWEMDIDDDEEEEDEEEEEEE